MTIKPMIVLKEKNIYGNTLLYPMHFKSDLETLTGKKTLNRDDIQALKNMGFDVYTQDQYFKACGNALGIKS